MNTQAAMAPGQSPRRILVIGGGIAGISAAVEAAEAGCQVVLVEREPYLGGRVAQMYQYFPKLCPPVCGLEINLRRIRTSPRITVHTQATVAAVAGGPGNYRVSVRQEPCFIAERCTACGKCAEVCPAERPSKFDFGMKTTAAAYLAYPGAWPSRYTIDKTACTAECTLCATTCPTHAIDLAATARVFDLDVSTVIWTTGWQPYEPTRLTDLGFGACRDVITNMMIERLASPHGPTAGRVLCPSDGRAPASVAFVQCAGSRDDAHLPYCSGLCCMASVKHARYLRAQYPDAEITIYYIDRRASGRQELFLAETERDPKIHFVPGKVARVSVDDGRPVVEVEDTAQGCKLKHKVDLVVLAAGMVPSIVDGNPGRVPKPSRDAPLPAKPAGSARDHFGFLVLEHPGQFAAGCAREPMDVASAVRDATSAVMRAMGER